LEQIRSAVMFTRLLLVLLLTATAVVPSAAQGNGQGASGGQGAGAASGPGGEGADNEGRGGNGNADGRPPHTATSDGQQSNHKSNHGGANAPGNIGAGDGANRGSGGKAHGGSNSHLGATSLTPDEALALVQTHRALPLSELAEIVQQRSGAEMVDAELLRVGQMLIYAIKVIDEAERLSVQYYYASSGRYIGSE
jgi:hypothetical protein